MPREYPTATPKRVGHLRSTRNQLVQTIHHLETRLTNSRARLVEVEQELAMATIAVRQVKAQGRNPYFRRGELIGSCLEVLRQAEAPLLVRDIIRAALAAKGLHGPDAVAVEALLRPVRDALHVAAKKGVVGHSGARWAHQLRWQITR